MPAPVRRLAGTPPGAAPAAAPDAGLRRRADGRQAPPPGWRAWLPLWALMLLVLALGLAGPAARAQPAAPGTEAPALVLAADTPQRSAWPVLRLWRPPAGQGPADARQAWLQRAAFAPPATPPGNLGPHDGTTWLHLPLQLAADAPATWYLALDYALLHRVQVSVLDAAGRLQQTVDLGARVAHDQRPMPTRALVAPLQLQPGQRQHLLLRIETPTAQLVEPLLLQPAALLAMENRNLAFLGAMSGVWLFMLLYTVAAWLNRRQGVFIAYAGTLVASWLFTQGIYGTGAMWFWPHSGWLAAHITVLAPPLMVVANAQFFVRALQMRQHRPRTARVLDGIAGLAALAVLGFLAGLLDYRQVAVASMLLGVLHLAPVVPAAAARRADGDRSASLVLAGCAANLVGIAGLTLLLRGHLPVHFVTLHLVQLTYVFEMVCWLLALGLQLELLRRTAAAAQLEREALRLLASTDPLTGLHNRRALETALESLLAAAPAPGADTGPQLALFLIDLDGFKAVNDRWGHEAGDQLLRQVADRLRAVARPQDVVARLGGDEFVLVVPMPLDEPPLARLGRRLMAQFEPPFRLEGGQTCRVGATVGCALAPQQGQGAADLLRAADGAMYAGKQAGRHTLVGAA